MCCVLRYVLHCMLTNVLTYVLCAPNVVLQMDAGQPFSTWIIKPSAGTMGRGISLVQAPAHLSELDATMLHGGNCTAAGQHGSGAVAGGGLGWGAAGSVVAQAYVDNPLLLGGYKFDLRVYALVLSADPLEVRVLMRFCCGCSAWLCCTMACCI